MRRSVGVMACACSFEVERGELGEELAGRGGGVEGERGALATGRRQGVDAREVGRALLPEDAQARVGLIARVGEERGRDGVAVEGTQRAHEVRVEALDEAETLAGRRAS